MSNQGERGTPPERIAQFRILGKLGEGGMGVVYRAEDEKLRRVVAIKLLADASGSEERRQRFLREARSAAAVTHPNVAVVYQVDEHEGRIFIAMELVEGASLRQRLERGPVDVPTALDIARQMARGLAAAHEKRIVHRDLKPENVMLDRTGTVKLLDFGLAKTGVDRRPESGKTEAALAKTETLVTSDEGRVMGTPEYMSPEQATGEPLDVRSDVFSFGIVLYEMLSGIRPFTGATTGAVLVAIARDPVRPLRERAPHVEGWVADLVTRCLAKAREERFADAGELLAALEGRDVQRSPLAVTESRTDVAPVSRSREATRASRRWWAVAGSVALLAVGGAWTARQLRGATTHPAPAASAQAILAPTASSEEPLARSSNPEAQRLFEEAMRSLHDGTGQTFTLLQKAVAADPTFGAAYVRLWWVAQNESPNRRLPEEYHLRLVALQGALSPRDRALLDALEATDTAAAVAKLDAYLARFPDDDVAWISRLDGTAATADRAITARPTLVPALVSKVDVLQAKDSSEADAQLDALLAKCLELSPYAVDCLGERAQLLDHRGDCGAAEADIRRALNLVPDGWEYRYELAGLLAARGASSAAIREALGSLPTDPVIISNGMLVAALLPMFDGDFAEVERIADDALKRETSAGSEGEHLGPYMTPVFAYTEAGDSRSAGRIANEFLSRRVAWKDPQTTFLGLMIGAAARGGFMTATEARSRLEAAYEAELERFRPLVSLNALAPSDLPSRAWASTYAGSVETAPEAHDALAKLTELGAAPQPHYFPAWIARTFFLGGRGEETRPLLEGVLKMCSGEFGKSMHWTRSHLYLGELDEQKGDTAAACGHYAKVLHRWGNAKPRSVTADEARAHAKKLACAPE